ncbi:MAG: hypothetical protein V1738_02600 [Patescibacteria group bacterium]
MQTWRRYVLMTVMAMSLLLLGVIIAHELPQLRDQLHLNLLRLTLELRSALCLYH